MKSIFSYLQGKHFWRSQRMGTGIAAKIFMGFFIIYFGVIFLVMGLFFDKLAEDIDPGKDLFSLLHQYLFYYLIFELVMRVIFQEVSEVKYRQLCLMPIKKSSIVHHILRGSAVSFFNFLPLLFLVPFVLKTVVPTFGIMAGLSWFVAVFSLLLFNNYLALQIKHWVSNNPVYYIVPAAISGVLYFLDSQGWLPFSKGLDFAFMAVIKWFVPAVIFIAMALLVYRLVFNRMFAQAYITGQFQSGSNMLENLSFGNLSERGFFGLVAQTNLQLMFRNKRIRTQVVMGFFMLLLGFVIFNNENYGPGFQLYIVLAMTGILAVSLAQFLWAYQAGYIELLWTIPVSLKKYINAQYNFLILACLTTSVLSLFYYFMDPELPLMILASFLFHIGVNIPVLMAASAYNRKKIEISSSGTFNMQGMGGTQILFQFLVLLVPLFIFAPFSIWGHKNTGLIVLSVIGLLGILLKPIVVKGIASLVKEKKYSLTEGYRSN